MANETRQRRKYIQFTGYKDNYKKIVRKEYEYRKLLQIRITKHSPILLSRSEVARHKGSSPKKK